MPSRTSQPVNVTPAAIIDAAVTRDFDLTVHEQKVALAPSVGDDGTTAVGMAYEIGEIDGDFGVLLVDFYTEDDGTLRYAQPVFDISLPGGAQSVDECRAHAQDKVKAFEARLASIDAGDGDPMDPMDPMAEFLKAFGAGPECEDDFAAGDDW